MPFGEESLDRLLEQVKRSMDYTNFICQKANIYRKKARDILGNFNKWDWVAVLVYATIPLMKLFQWLTGYNIAYHLSELVGRSILNVLSNVLSLAIAVSAIYLLYRIVSNVITVRDDKNNQLLSRFAFGGLLVVIFLSAANGVLSVDHNLNTFFLFIFYILALSITAIWILLRNLAYSKFTFLVLLSIYYAVVRVSIEWLVLVALHNFQICGIEIEIINAVHQGTTDLLNVVMLAGSFQIAFKSPKSK